MLSELESMTELQPATSWDSFPWAATSPVIMAG